MTTEDTMHDEELNEPSVSEPSITAAPYREAATKQPDQPHAKGDAKVKTNMTELVKTALS